MGVYEDRQTLTDQLLLGGRQYDFFHLHGEAPVASQSIIKNPLMIRDAATAEQRRHESLISGLTYL